MKIIFVTSNRNKFREVKKIAEKFGIELVYKDLKLEEIQGELEEIAKRKAFEAFEALKLPVVVEDTSFEIDALNGFPGVYASFFYRKIGVEGILKLMEGVENRRARFIACAVYFDGSKLITSKGEVKGRISEKARGEGWGFDPIFIPEGYNCTFGENPELKQKLSHRAKAFSKIFRKLFEAK